MWLWKGLSLRWSERNRLLAEAGVTKLSHYNRKVEHGERLPRIWLFHDELADWMMIKEYRDAVELNANRIGVKARAAGINLVLVTQRPDKDALPMQLRANLSNRLVLKVADKRNSELVLDEAGAERLLGRGHLAAKLSGEGKIILAQVPFIDEDEIVEVAGLIARAWHISRNRLMFELICDTQGIPSPCRIDRRYPGARYPALADWAVPLTASGRGVARGLP